MFGLERHDGEDVADPYGLVRTRTMTNKGRQLRLVLNVPALGGRRQPESADYQHIAFRTDDIVASAQRARARGLPTLTVPGNYYDDLASFVDLDPTTIATMRDLNILFDSDEVGGGFFHYYTAIFGRRMFFEIVQRTNGYDGYGARNTPVRTAAQYRNVVLAGITA